MKNNKKPKQYKTLHRIIKVPVRFYLKRIFDLEVTYINEYTKPYVLIGNHINNYDPIIVSAYTKDQVNFIASDEYFRNRMLRFLLKIFGAIPKTKFLSDMSTVKNAIKVKKNNGIIGVFPEGTRSWDGHTMPLIYSTAKMIKLLNIDVVAAIVKGAMFNQPRWAKKSRKGKTYLTYKKILTKKEVIEMDTKQIYERISNYLMHDEYEHQKKLMNKYKGKNLARKIELFLYVCPKCKSFHTIESVKDKVFCKNCGYELIYNQYGFFEGTNVIFDNTRDWNHFQLNETAKLIKKPFSYKANNVLLKVGEKKKHKLKKISYGTFHINNDGFYYVNFKKQKLIFNYNEISGVNVQYNRKLEFYKENTLYRFNFIKSNISAFSIKNIILGCLELKGVNNE